MKIAFVVPGFSADETDWCIPAHTDIVRALAAQHDVHVFALRYPHRADRYRIGNATVHSFGGANARGLDTAQLWLRVQSEMTREHARGAFDIIHAIFGGEAGCLTVLLAKRLRARSAVWLLNGELIGLRQIGYGADLNARLRWMNGIVLRYADAVLCGCEAMADAARARMKAARHACVETLPLGVNTTRFGTCPPAPLLNRSGAIEFVNVGSLLPVKDQRTLLRAFARVLGKLPRAHLTIAGTGPLENDLRARARALQIETRVTFAGQIPHDELPALYRSADVFVQSSLHEGQGMAMLEAAACGCAVCGTNVGALHDVAQGGGAKMCAAGNADTLVQTMVEAYNARAMWSERARQCVEREYTLETIAARLTRLYQGPAKV